ncbi:Kinetochor_Ybp2 domain-containing protein [Cephalotus follicularis]|uniref:Kinetochor_Ybp2 domain-containing protein n=1 Tax=Cephalotus follicularis TaxID=3775 RepID=A0A1Q3BRC1_CEPFO|nr:Kinetochor_Ybp2 domain-containing protein [Cephalotus follicularis]
MSTESAELREPSSLVVLRLHQTLASCSKAIKGGDGNEFESLITELVNFLDSISSAALSEPDDEGVKNNAIEVLSEMHKYLSSPSLDQVVIDALSFELPKAVSKFAGLSARCLEISTSVIDVFIVTCNPRDMLAVLCEALDSESKTTMASSYLVPLFSGLSKVLLSIQRRHFEQVKVTVPVILKVLKTMMSESYEETELADLFDKAIGIASSIRAVCVKVEGRVNEKLRALLGLYLLQIMVLVSVSMGHRISSCVYLVSELSHFFPYCGFSFLGLITGCDVDKITSIALGEDDDDCVGSLSYVKPGASLSVIWGHISDRVAQAAEENLSAVKGELQSNQTTRWQSLGMLKHALSLATLPWELKKHAIDFLLSIMDGNVSLNCKLCHDEHSDCSTYMPSLFAALQAITMVMMYAPDPVLRKNAFEALKRVLADIPASPRFEILQALITNIDSSSLTAILLDFVRGDIFKKSCQKLSIRQYKVSQDENEGCSITLFGGTSVLQLVDLVLRPPKGGPPLLPEHGEAVLSALNLYRFVFITESTGKTNYTEILSRNNLLKAYNEWLLPLRTLLRCMAENKKEYDQLCIDIGCVLNPVELVLYRCIELVEEQLSNLA